MKIVNKPMYVCDYCGKQSDNEKEIQLCEKKHKALEERNKKQAELIKQKRLEEARLKDLIADYEKKYNTRFWCDTIFQNHSQNDLEIVKENGETHYYRNGNEISCNEFARYLDEFYC